jgi:xanthosine utilization system XapX-like protein
MSDFVGFYSTSADISTMTILTSPLATGEVFATIDNLYLAVPAPGAAALIGLAGLVARRRRA